MKILIRFIFIGTLLSLGMIQQGCSSVARAGAVQTQAEKEKEVITKIIATAYTGVELTGEVVSAGVNQGFISLKVSLEVEAQLKNVLQLIDLAESAVALGDFVKANLLLSQANLNLDAASKKIQLMPTKPH